MNQAERLPTREALARSALAQHEQARIWREAAQCLQRVANQRLEHILKLSERGALLEARWRQALAFGILVGACFGAVAGLLWGFLKWGAR